MYEETFWNAVVIGETVSDVEGIWKKNRRTAAKGYPGIWLGVHIDHGLRGCAQCSFWYALSHSSGYRTALSGLRHYQGGSAVCDWSLAAGLADESRYLPDCAGRALLWREPLSFR